MQRIIVVNIAYKFNTDVRTIFITMISEGVDDGSAAICYCLCGGSSDFV